MGEIVTPKPDVHSSRRTMYHKPQKPPHSRAWAHPTAPHSRPLPAAPRPARTSPPASCAWGQLSRPHTTEHLTWLSGTRQEEGARGSSSTPAASRAGAPGGSGPLQTGERVRREGLCSGAGSLGPLAQTHAVIRPLSAHATLLQVAHTHRRWFFTISTLSSPISQVGTTRFSG